MFPIFFTRIEQLIESWGRNANSATIFDGRQFQIDNCEYLIWETQKEAHFLFSPSHFAKKKLKIVRDKHLEMEQKRLKKYSPDDRVVIAQDSAHVDQIIKDQKGNLVVLFFAVQWSELCDSFRYELAELSKHYTNVGFVECDCDIFFKQFL